MRRPTDDEITRFWSHVDFGPHPKGCWLWTGAQLRKTRHGQNLTDMRRRGRAGDCRNLGENHGLAKLTEAVVIECRQRYARGETQLKLAAEFGVRNTTLSMAITGKTWTHI